MNDKTTVQIECPKCHRPILASAGWIKVKCQCGEIVVKQVADRTGTK